MQVDNRLLDDLSRVATGAFAALTGVREEVETRLREQFERVLSRMDVVTREEFEAVRTMAANARAAQEALEARLAMLESRLAEAAQAPQAAAKKRAEPAPKG
ncbi:MAG TPA: accessory factor UbiK family protein [Aliidongia sp.]|nr:accessory factor UbiK family protein [Aliidongia sp.]